MDQRSLRSIADLFERERRALIEEISAREERSRGFAGAIQPDSEKREGFNRRNSAKRFSGGMEENMEYKVEESGDHRGAYVVGTNEAKSGESLSVLFSGPDAKRHAEEYVVWKNSQQEVTEEQLLRR